MRLGRKSSRKTCEGPIPLPCPPWVPPQGLRCPLTRLCSARRRDHAAEAEAQRRRRVGSRTARRRCPPSRYIFWGLPCCFVGSGAGHLGEGAPPAQPLVGAALQVPSRPFCHRCPRSLEAVPSLAGKAEAPQHPSCPPIPFLPAHRPRLGTAPPPRWHHRGPPLHPPGLSRSGVLGVPGPCPSFPVPQRPLALGPSSSSALLCRAASERSRRSETPGTALAHLHGHPGAGLGLFGVLEAFGGHHLLVAADLLDQDRVPRLSKRVY